MINRFKRIKTEFGNKAFYKTLLLIIGMLLMAIVPVFYYKNPIFLLTVILGLFIGYMLRKQIVNLSELLPKITSIGLYGYGIILFIGDRIGINDESKILIITITTVIIFNFNYWVLSDKTIINLDNEKNLTNGSN